MDTTPIVQPTTHIARPEVTDLRVTRQRSWRKTPQPGAMPLADDKLRTSNAEDRATTAAPDIRAAITAVLHWLSGSRP